MKRTGPSCLDPTFKYTEANSTDLRKTFARIRREQREAAKPAAKPQATVVTLDNARKTTAR